MLFGVPKARILQAFRTSPWLPRRISKTIVFYCDITAFVGRKKCFSIFSPTLFFTNALAKIAPLAGLHRLPPPGLILCEFETFWHRNRRMYQLKSHLWPACRLVLRLSPTPTLRIRRMSLLKSHLWPACRLTLRLILTPTLRIRRISQLK